MPAATYDIVLEQGATFARHFAVTRAGFDFTGYVPRAKVRRTFGGDVVATFAVANLVAGVGSIEWDLALTAEQTALIAGAGTEREQDLGVWDCEIAKPGAPELVERLVQGRATLSLEATA